MQYNKKFFQTSHSDFLFFLLLFVFSPYLSKPGDINNSNLSLYMFHQSLVFF
jgi:hypothetical protein